MFMIVPLFDFLVPHNYITISYPEIICYICFVSLHNINTPFLFKGFIMYIELKLSFHTISYKEHVYLLTKNHLIWLYLYFSVLCITNFALNVRYKSMYQMLKKCPND